LRTFLTDMHKTKNEELQRISPEEFKNAEKTPLAIVLDNVRSLHNIGSVFRTADAFLVRGICLCGVTATPPHRDIEKTALGATALSLLNRPTGAYHCNNTSPTPMKRPPLFSGMKCMV
jgi:tRNA G18 (ribose-2'-O)-methylase SpoU